jgi:uncharacterized protein DUF1566
MKSSRNFVARVIAVVLVALALTPTAAGAIDVRSWDQRIDNVNQRFVVLNAFENQAVLDKETQLVWQRTPETTAYGYSTAIKRCVIPSTGGRGGWRLPTVHELRSLLTAGDGYVLPAGHPFVVQFPVPTPRIWTSTKNTLDGTLSFYTLELNDLYSPMEASPASSHFVWCVRGPAADGAGY